MQTFKPGDTKKALTITLIHHEGYTQEKDFYVLLKNPMGKAELGEPNLARITIIDDDGNDLDLCEKYIVTGLQIMVGRWTLTDQNLLMSVVVEPKDNFWSYLNRWCEIVVICHDRTTTNMDPRCTYFKHC